MLPYEAQPGDVDHMIADDHLIVEAQFLHLEAGRGDRRVLVDQVAFELALHAAAEERVVYPVLRDAGVLPEVDDALAAHRRMKELLVVLDGEEPGEERFEEALDELIASVRAHVHEEEGGLLPRLRAAVTAEALVALGEEFLDAKRSAPTRAHPHGPSGRTGHRLTDVVTMVVDTARDLRSGRADHLGTDGSGLLVPQAQAILDALAEISPRPFEILTPDAARKLPGPDAAVRRVMDRTGVEGPEPVGDVEDLRIPDAAGGEQRLRVYRPAGAGSGPLPVLMWIHGGGWVLFDIDTYDASCRGMCNRAGAIVVSPDYRRAPEAPFPAAHEDVLAAWRWTIEHADELGIDVARTAVGGESVGGNMAAATALALAAAGEARPRATVCVYPLTTALEYGASMTDAADARPLNKALLSWMAMHAFAGAPDAARDPRVDLLSLPGEVLAGLPPTLVIVDQRDPLRSQGEEFARHVQAAGVPVRCLRYDGVMHEFFGAAAVLEQAADAQDEAAAWVRDAWKPVTSGGGPR